MRAAGEVSREWPQPTAMRAGQAFEAATDSGYGNCPSCRAVRLLAFVAVPCSEPRMLATRPTAPLPPHLREVRDSSVLRRAARFSERPSLAASIGQPWSPVRTRVLRRSDSHHWGCSRDSLGLLSGAGCNVCEVSHAARSHTVRRVRLGAVREAWRLDFRRLSDRTARIIVGHGCAPCRAVHSERS